MKDYNEYDYYDDDDNYNRHKEIKRFFNAVIFGVSMLFVSWAIAFAIFGFINF